MEIYCFKCKVKREARDLKEYPAKNGKIRVGGTCTKCGGGVSTFKSGTGGGAKTAAKKKSKKK